MRALVLAAISAAGAAAVALAPAATATPAPAPPPYVDHVEWAKWGDLSSLRVYPTPVTPGPVPTVSNVNLSAGVTRANLVTVPVGSDGRVRETPEPVFDEARVQRTR